MDPNQPRPPKDLEGLLKFCMEATQREDAPSSSSALEDMDPARRQWLTEALSSMTVDVIKELAEAIKILNSNVVSDASASADQVGTVEYAFECVSDWVDQVDSANNFHKIGGFEALRNCLNSPHATLRALAANTVAELSQNNPYCQEKFTSEGFLPLLLQMLAKNEHEEEGESCKVKALYAISCITRDFPQAQQVFLSPELEGHSVLVRAIMHHSAARLKIKACFFVSSLSQENEEAKKAFADMGLHRQLIVMLQSEEHAQAHEHMAKALLTLLKGNKEVQNECIKSPELALKNLVQTRIEALQHNEQFDEERAHFLEIDRICFENSAAGISLDR